MDVLTEDVRDGSLIELLYADDHVLCGGSLNEVMVKYGRWKNAVEGKGLRVNVDKTKGMQLLFGKKSSVSKVDLCGVCGERIFSLRNVRNGFIVAILMYRGQSTIVSGCLSVENVLVIIVQ